MIISANGPLPKTTDYQVVIPFYAYAAVSFLLACAMLLLSGDAYQQHYFHPQTLAITHLMALGWGTMMILGASHQLVPVLTEGKLYSNKLAYLSFGLAGAGIPLLVYAFYNFNMGWPAHAGALAINGGIIAYLINVGMSMAQSPKKSIYTAFIFAAGSWLLLTTLMGLSLVCNFTHPILSSDSLSYLPVHAHMGMVGWFLLLVIGVGARLIPMFLISKYTHDKLLWVIFAAINLGLLLFIVVALWVDNPLLQLAPALLVATGIGLFVCYCRQAYKQRIRKQVDHPMIVSLLSIAMILLPLVLLLVLIGLTAFTGTQSKLVLVYGFVIFFGWLTAIILGMTFKTLPFIVWNKVYHLRSGGGKTPNPKDLYSEKQFKWMALSYLAGFSLFIMGLLLQLDLVLKTGAVCLLLAAFLYNANVLKTILHKPIAA